MKITKLQKEAIYGSGLSRITVEITLESSDLANFDYEGLDLLPDEMIPEILISTGKMYIGKIKNGKFGNPTVKA